MAERESAINTPHPPASFLRSYSNPGDFCGKLAEPNSSLLQTIASNRIVMRRFMWD